MEEEQKESDPFHTFVGSFADQTALIGVTHLRFAALLKFCSCTPNTKTLASNDVVNYYPLNYYQKF